MSKYTVPKSEAYKVTVNAGNTISTRSGAINLINSSSSHTTERLKYIIDCLMPSVQIDKDAISYLKGKIAELDFKNELKQVLDE